MPGPCKPIELSIPEGVSAIRGVGLPYLGLFITDLVTTAPILCRSKNCANSLPELAQPLASTLADYVMPGATEVPNIRMDHFETPSPHTEFGAKGMGEGGAIAPPAAIFGAVNDALRRVGAAELTRTPLTPRRVLQALEQKTDVVR